MSALPGLLGVVTKASQADPGTGSRLEHVLGWIQLAAETAIFAALTSVPLFLLIYARQRRLAFPRIVWLSATVLFAIGLTHLLEAVSRRLPADPLATALASLAAVAALAVVVALIVALPRVLARPSVDALLRQLEATSAERASFKERYEDAVRGTSEGLFDWTMGSEEMRFSTRFWELLGYGGRALPPDGVASLRSHLHPADAQRFWDELERPAHQGRPVDTEVRFRARDGSERWFRVRAMVSLDAEGVPRRVIGAVQDVTGHRRMHRELELRTTEMEQFLYTVSHDLKSPLVTCMGYVGLLEEELAEGNAEGARDAARRIQMATRRMSTLIDDLLELSRAGRTLGEPREIDPGPMLRELREMLHERLQERGTALEVAPDLPPVVADERALVRVFENLLENALKYATDRPGTTIRVGGRRQGDEVWYFVQDQGPGIEPQYHRKIFGLFQRLDGSQEGTGVGLALVARVMELHEGRAWVESEPGKGATFWLAFPGAA